jgi:hypothetical protein
MIAKPALPHLGFSYTAWCATAVRSDALLDRRLNRRWSDGSLQSRKKTFKQNQSHKSQDVFELFEMKSSSGD